MHSNLHFVLEARPRTAGGWRTIFRLCDLGAAPVLHEILGGPRVGVVPPPICATPRGLPHDVADESLDEDSWTVSDDPFDAAITDALRRERVCTRARADEWVRSGRARFICDGEAVTDPATYGHSWLDRAELSQLLETARGYEGELLDILRAILAAMESLEREVNETRVVYWFE